MREGRAGPFFVVMGEVCFRAGRGLGTYFFEYRKYLLGGLVLDCMVEDTLVLADTFDSMTTFGLVFAGSLASACICFSTTDGIPQTFTSGVLVRFCGLEACE